MEIEIKQILTQSIGFLVMLWILKKFAWKPLLNLLEERKQKIQSEFDQIEEQKNEIKKDREEYEKKVADIDALAKSKTLHAVHEGHRIARGIKEEALHQAKAIIQRTHNDREREIGKARLQLREEIVNLTMIATEKLLQENLDPEKQKKLILDFLEKTR